MRANEAPRRVDPALAARVLDHGVAAFAPIGRAVGRAEGMEPLDREPHVPGVPRRVLAGAGIVTEIADILETLHLDQVSEKQLAREILPANATEAAHVVADRRRGGRPPHRHDRGAAARAP